jgi:hypothetical protein
MLRRVFQAAILKAANGNLSAARIVLSEFLDRQTQQQKELLSSLMRVAMMAWLFSMIIAVVVSILRTFSPHPSHIVIENNEVRFAGPIDYDGEMAWERLKQCVSFSPKT